MGNYSSHKNEIYTQTFLALFLLYKIKDNYMLNISINKTIRVFKHIDNVLF